MARADKEKTTSTAVAKKASKALRDGRSSARTKSLAGSALAQAEPQGKEKKAEKGKKAKKDKKAKKKDKKAKKGK